MTLYRPSRPRSFCSAPSSCDKFAALATIASDWWWETDAELRFTFISDGFRQRSGLPDSAVIGKRRTEIRRSDYDRPEWQAHLEDLRQRRPFKGFETTFVDVAGVSHPLKISGTPLFEGDGAFRGYIGVGHDLTALRQREREALARAAELDSVLENIEQGVALFDEQNRVAVYNRRLGEWLGIADTREAAGKNFAGMVRCLADRGADGEEDKQAAIERRPQLIQADKFSGERVGRDGRIFAVNYTALPQGGGVMTYSDVTEARQREAATVRSEARFRKLFAESPIAKWVYSVQTLRFLEVNEAVVAMYGYTREELLSMTLHDIRPPEQIARLERWLANPQDPSLRGDWVHRRKDGSLIDVELHLSEMDFESEPARLAVITDVTARKRAQRQRERIFETSQDLILITDPFGRMVEVSPSALAVIGYRPDELLGRLASEVIAPDLVERAREEMRTLRSGKLTRSFRCSLLHKRGHPVPLDWKGTWSEQDRCYFFAGRDMSEYERKEQQLAQAQKMEAVGQLTGGVAHDFNNLLAVIMFNAEALTEDETLPEETLDRLRQIGRSVDRAADLTRQLLAFSRRQSLRPQVTDINDLVNGTGKMLRRAISEHIEIEMALGTQLGAVNVDRAQLETALVNLCINARDAMPTGGKVRISTRVATLDADRLGRDSDVAPGCYVEIDVEDTGTGMPPHIVSRIFEPFFTTKEQGKGTGLGLSMVYGFIKQSQGHIEVESTVERGTTFRLYLPRTDLASVEEVERKCVAVCGRERILLVEDEQAVRHTVEQQLCALGYDVTGAADGASALAACSQAKQPFDLVLTDVIMPGMSGKALAEQIKGLWPDTSVVYMSGYSEDIITRNGQLASDVMVIKKPFRKSELARIVREALGSANLADAGVQHAS